MTTYILLFNLTEAGIKAAKDSPRRLDRNPSKPQCAASKRQLRFRPRGCAARANGASPTRSPADGDLLVRRTLLL